MCIIYPLYQYQSQTLESKIINDNNIGPHTSETQFYYTTSLFQCEQYTYN